MKIIQDTFFMRAVFVPTAVHLCLNSFFTIARKHIRNVFVYVNSLEKWIPTYGVPYKSTDIPDRSVIVLLLTSLYGTVPYTACDRRERGHTAAELQHRSEDSVVRGQTQNGTRATALSSFTSTNAVFIHKRLSAACILHLIGSRLRGK